MSVQWVRAAVVVTIVVCVVAERGGSSLRGALEALQRRQRGRIHSPIVSEPDYDAIYDFLPPQAYAEPDYDVDVENVDEESAPKYVIKFLEDSDRRPESYQYRVVKKKNSHPEIPRKDSPFRERTHHSDNDRLRDLFMESTEVENKKDTQERSENDAEYALLLSQLWSKYKNHKQHSNKEDSVPQGVVHLYKDKIVKKRMPDNWGPIAYKRKRSSDSENIDNIPEFENERKQDSVEDSNYNGYELTDDDKDDLREEYAIAFQPLDDDSLSDLTDDEQYSLDTREKRFPVTKRSSDSYDNQNKRSIQNQDKHKASRKYRSSSGTDPKIVKDLSSIFGDPYNQIIKSPVKRSSANEEHVHEGKPPNLTILNQTNTHQHNNTNSSQEDSNSHEQHGHNIHHPGLSGKEIDVIHDSSEDKPIQLKKKSIDWSDYFGIDKRKKKSTPKINGFGQERLRKQYFNTFNKEVLYPLNSFRQHSYVKRNYLQNKPNEETALQVDNTKAVSVRNDKSINNANDNDSKLDNIDKKLRNMEDMIVDEALNYSNSDDEDSKEDQETKEKLLSRLAAAYSLEKMRKALKEFKQSLQTQKSSYRMRPSQSPTDESKAKRVAIKKEKVEIQNNVIPKLNKEKMKDDFEDEQGAGHYLNGKMDETFSEGYMGGSGRRYSPVLSKGADGSCPVLVRIVQRCHGVDMLAGDRGQLFLPLCSLHQICYLCGEAPPTTCDLVFLSEADTTCAGDMACQRAARSALMALRDLHDNLADELDGECEASPCLSATLKLNVGWQQALQR